MVPPRVDLYDYRAIALIEFTSDADGNLGEFSSQKFIEALQSCQPGVGVLELGEKAEVLRVIGRDELDHKAIRAIGEEYNVDAVVVGEVEVTDVKPSVDFQSMLSLSGGVRADVEAAMTVRLFDSLNGATIWTNSARCKENVAHIGISSNGSAHFGASDPEEAYGKLVNGLVYSLTDDFRVHYVRQ